MLYVFDSLTRKTYDNIRINILKAHLSGQFKSFDELPDAVISSD